MAHLSDPRLAGAPPAYRGRQARHPTRGQGTGRVGVVSKGWGKGSTRRWRRTRAAVLQRDGWVCRVGLPGCTTAATCVHHTKGRAVTGDDPTHLVASCRNCNLKVGDPQKRSNDPKAAPITKW